MKSARGALRPLLAAAALVARALAAAQPAAPPDGSGASAPRAELVSPKEAGGGRAVEDWFARSGVPGAYAAVAADILGLSEGLRAQGIPDRPLAERLAEGAGKRVEPRRLVEALREDAERFRVAAGALRAAGLFAASEAEASDDLAAAGLLLRSGIGAEELEAALLAAASPSAQPGRGAAERGASRAFAALAAVRAVDARFPLEAEDRRELGVALAGSRVAAARFDSLVSAFARGRVAGLSASRIAAIAAGALQSGGSIDAIEKEIERRARKP